MRYWGIVWTIAAKDLRTELRTKERVAAMGAFVVLVGVMFTAGLDVAVVAPKDVAAGLIWMTMVFSGLLGMGRTFEMEDQDGALTGLLESPIPLDALFLGKVVANTILLAIVVGLTFVVFGAFFRLQYQGHPLALLAAVGSGVVGLVSIVTLFSGVSARTTMGESLLPVLVFPLVVPLIVFGASATNRLFAGRPVAEVAGNLRLLGAFALAGLLAGAWLFRYVIEE